MHSTESINGVEVSETLNPNLPIFDVDSDSELEEATLSNERLEEPLNRNVPIDLELEEPTGEQDHELEEPTGEQDQIGTVEPPKKKHRKTRPRPSFVETYGKDFVWIKTSAKKDGEHFGECCFCGTTFNNVYRQKLSRHEKSHRHKKAVKLKEDAKKNSESWNLMVANAEDKNRTIVKYKKWGMVLERFLSEHIGLRTIERLLTPEFIEMLKTYPSLPSRAYFRGKV